MKIANAVLGDSPLSRPDWVALRDWLEEARRPDIVALQKTGPISEANERALTEIGYADRFMPSPHPHLGVAVLNRRALGEPEVLPGLDWEKVPRFLAVRIGKLRVCSLYVPWSDPEAPRAAWLNRLRDHVEEQRYAGEHCLLCGDFNVSKIDRGKEQLYVRYEGSRTWVSPICTAKGILTRRARPATLAAMERSTLHVST